MDSALMAALQQKAGSSQSPAPGGPSSEAPTPTPTGKPEKEPVSKVEQAISKLQEIISDPTTEEGDKAKIERAVNVLRSKGPKEPGDEKKSPGEKFGYGKDDSQNPYGGVLASELGIQ